MTLQSFQVFLTYFLDIAYTWIILKLLVASSWEVHFLSIPSLHTSFLFPLHIYVRNFSSRHQRQKRNFLLSLIPPGSLLFASLLSLYVLAISLFPSLFHRSQFPHLTFYPRHQPKFWRWQTLRRFWSFGKPQIVKNTSRYRANTFGFYPINGKEVVEFMEHSTAEYECAWFSYHLILPILIQ
jgi:hypothetical protein